ncbi:DHA1 family quinolone resistance protein-like MFS transporter [Fontibacillus phaseoli]|uniref:DHA1 family quinolone resistance protein-like MFS transporter n=1 Tax=Fontibacillus phaseoli TaxID=1416533 RepID=A0A369BJ27_9BACL|nr:MFS transporter [Fontibacillus phaseoli]RCX21602.1 DHA1 family quinolone resistance protein-like MFS transporter [Fontibacillus phaseoli]
MKSRLFLNGNIICLIIISLITNMSGSMILPLFALYVEKFGISAFGMSILFSLFYVGRFCGGSITGRVYNKIGAKRLGVILLVAEIVCMISFPFANAFIILAMLRILQGIVAIGLSVFVRITVNNISTNENRGILNGYVSSSEGAGMILGPVISGLIVTYFSLSMPFYFVGFIAFISLIAVTRMRFPGIVVNSENTELFEEGGFKKNKLKKQLFLYSTVHFLEMSAYAIFLTYFSVYAKYKLGWDALEISLAFTVVGVSTFVSAPFVGKLSDILRDRLLLCIAGLFFIMVEICSFLFFTDKWIIYSGMLIGGIGGACYLDSFYSHIGDVIPIENRSTFMGNLVSLSELGSIVSPLIAGVLIQKFNNDAPFYYNLILVALAMMIQALVRTRTRIRKNNDLNQGM